MPHTEFEEEVGDLRGRRVKRGIPGWIQMKEEGGAEGLGSLLPGEHIC